jgi:hypothetical protein
MLCCAVLLRRQGVGVTGGTPFGFDVGQPRDAPGSALPGIDKGVIGMRVGGQRRLLVPPELVSLCRMKRGPFIAGRDDKLGVGSSGLAGVNTTPHRMVVL